MVSQSGSPITSEFMTSLPGKHEIAVILPAFNEEVSIGPTLRDFASYLPDAYFVVVDNGSRDNTFQRAKDSLKELNISGQIIFEPNRGKAMAVRRAFRQVNAEIYVLVDADLTYPAKHVLDLIDAIKNKSADMVVGNRHANNTYKTVNSRKFHNFGNIAVRNSVNALFKSNLKDILSGYRAFSKEFVKTFPILTKGFELELELTLHSLDKRMTVMEIPVEYLDRLEDSHSKLSTLKDGAKVISSMIKIAAQYKPLRVFGGLSILFCLMGTLFGVAAVQDYVLYHYVEHLPSAVLAVALEIIAGILLAVGLILRSQAELARMNFELNLLATKL